MAKQGMKRPERTHLPSRNQAAAVPEIQGKAKSGKTKAAPIIVTSKAPSQKVYHVRPYPREKPISGAYPTIDNDLARDNLENDMPAADLEDL